MRSRPHRVPSSTARAEPPPCRPSSFRCAAATLRVPAAPALATHSVHDPANGELLRRRARDRSRRGAERIAPRANRERRAGQRFERQTRECRPTARYGAVTLDAQPTNSRSPLRTTLPRFSLRSVVRGGRAAARRGLRSTRGRARSVLATATQTPSRARRTRARHRRHHDDACDSDRARAMRSFRARRAARVRR